MKETLSWPSQGNNNNWKNAKAALKYFQVGFFCLLCMLLEHSKVNDELLDVFCGFDFNILSSTDYGSDNGMDVNWCLDQLKKLVCWLSIPQYCILTPSLKKPSSLV